MKKYNIIYVDPPWAFEKGWLWQRTASTAYAHADAHTIGVIKQQRTSGRVKLTKARSGIEQTSVCTVGISSRRTEKLFQVIGEENHERISPLHQDHRSH